MVAVVVALAVLACWSPAAKARTGFTDEGNMSLSIGGGLSSNVFSIGGSFGYFIRDNLMPGICYFYVHESRDKPVSHTVDSNQLNLFLRYYIVDLGGLIPFVTGDVGYENRSQSGADIVDQSFNLYNVMGGGGIVFFVGSNFAIEATLGMRKYVSVPKALEDGDFDDQKLEYYIGFGIYL
jgi:hypothetical protein